MNITLRSERKRGDLTGNRTRGHLLLFVGLFVTLAGFSLFRASVTSSAQLLHPDERLMSYIVLDRFAGVAQAALEWPAGPLQIAGVPLIAADYALHHPISPDTFVRYVGEAYRQPWHTVWLLRCLVVLTCASGLAAFGVMILRRTGDVPLAVVAAIACATIPLFWRHSRSATGDAMSVGFIFAALALVAEAESAYALIVGGGLFGFAIASKYPIALLAPMAFAIVVETNRTKPMRAARALALVGIGAAMALAIGIPYLWADPMRLLKAVGGAVSRQGTSPGPLGAAQIFLAAFPVWTWIVVPCGLVAAFVSRRYWVAAGLVVSLLIQIVVIGRAGVIYPRYLLGLSALVGIATWMTAEWFARSSGRVYWTGWAALCACCLVNAIGDLRLPTRLSAPTIAEGITEMVAAHPSIKSVAVSWYDAPDALAYANEASLLRLVESCTQAESAEVRGERRLQIPVAPSLARYLPRVFADDEESCAARALLMSSVPPVSPALDVVVWGWDQLPQRFGVPDVGQVLADRKAERIDLIISRRKLPGELPARVWKNGLSAY